MLNLEPGNPPNLGVASGLAYIHRGAACQPFDAVINIVVVIAFTRSDFVSLWFSAVPVDDCVLRCIPSR